MERIYQVISQAKSSISSLLWPPKVTKKVFNQILKEIINKTTFSDIISKLVIGIVDDDQFIDITRHIYDASSSKDFKEKVCDNKLVIFYYINPLEGFVPINVVSVDGIDNFILFQDDIYGDLTLSIPIKTQYLKEYIDVVSLGSQELFGNSGFIEEEIMRIINSIFIAKDSRKESIAIKYVGNINYRLSTIGNYYKAFLFSDFQSIIASIEKFLDEIKELFHVRFITYANHDPEHTKNVAKSLSQGLLDIHGENLFFRLNMIERYLLISSALLHDIGMALTDSVIKELDLERWNDIIKIDKDEIVRELEGGSSHIKKREKVRKYHAYIGGSFVSDLLSRYIRNENLLKYMDLQNRVSTLVAAHSLTFNLKKIDPVITCTHAEKEYTVRFRLLAALLRLADCFDITIKRVDPIKADLIELWKEEPSQVKHWAFKLLIGKVSLVPYDDGFAPCIQHAALDEDEEFGVKIFEGINLLEDVSAITNVLQEAGKIGDTELDIELNIKPIVIVENINKKHREILDGRNLKSLKETQKRSEERLLKISCDVLSRYLGHPLSLQ